MFYLDLMSIVVYYPDVYAWFGVISSILPLMSMLDMMSIVV